MSIGRHAGNARQPRIISPETMYDTILAFGIIPFFENSIRGFSIEEMTPAGNWFDSQEDLRKTPWDWKIECIRSGDIAYGKFLGGKAAFASIPVYRHLMNWRRSLPRYEVQEGPQAEVLDYVEKNGSVSIREIRGLLGVKKAAADALVTKLQMATRLVTGDIVRVYRGADLHYNGWQTSSFCTPDALFEAGVPDWFGHRTARNEEISASPDASRDFLLDLLRRLAPDAGEAQRLKLLA